MFDIHAHHRLVARQALRANTEAVNALLQQLLQLRRTAFLREDSYFRTYADLTDEEADATARVIWHAINLPNLQENILPTRERATMVFTKGPAHRVESLYLRKE